MIYNCFIETPSYTKTNDSQHERERKKIRERERKSKKDYKMGNAYKKFSVVWLGHNKIYFGQTNIKITFVIF